MRDDQVVADQHQQLAPLTGDESAAVLYAAPHGPQSVQSLLRAEALARARGERLIVLRVIPRVGPGDPLFPHQTHARSAHLLRLEAAVERLTVRWCARHLMAPPRPGDVRVRRGTLDEGVQAICAEEEVSLILLPRLEGLDGARVEALALETRTPVLLASRQGPSDLVVAGSDLEDRSYPVLRFARDFCTRLRAPSLFLHNVSPILMAAPVAGAPAPLAVDQAPDLLADRERRLSAAAQRVDTGAGIELQRELDAATALVEVASERGADLVVVGARPRPWWRMIGGTVAARVVDRSSISVMVLPLAPPPAWYPRAWG